MSFMHGVIKIFDKILACRLAHELPNLIGPHQSVFVKGRSLHHNFMLEQSMARRLHALKHPTIMLKLDISKAFGTIQWAFLLEVLQRMGFGRMWTNWMAGILATSSTHVMVNGTPGAPIHSCKGLRQGACPPWAGGNQTKIICLC